MKKRWLRVGIGTVISSLTTLHFMGGGLPMIDYVIVFDMMFVIFLAIDLLFLVFSKN